MRTIRWRLAVPYVLLIILAMLGLSLFLANTLRTTYENDLRSSLSAEAKLLSAAIQPYLAVNSPDPATIENLAHQYAASLHARVTIIAIDGKVLGESETNPALMENHLNRPEVKVAIDGSEASDIRYSTTLKTDMLYMAGPVIANGHVIGVARLAVSLNNIEANLSNIRKTVLFAGLVTALLVGMISILLTSYTLKPLRELTQAARRVESGDFRPVPYAPSHDEIGQLNQAFNQMANRLQEQIGALQSERSKLSAVLGQMSDGVIIIDAQGDVQLINPAAERLFGLGPVPNGSHSLIELVRHHQLVDLWKRTVESGVQQSITLELSAEHLFLQAIASPLKQALPGTTLLLVQDLTRLRRLETVRQDFISNVSHELRTPLASLKALVETLQEGALEDPPAARRFLTRMETEIDTLTQMVRELLELSRIESGKVPLQRRKLAPIDLITPAAERMRVQAERAGLTLHMECPDNLPPVYADAERMETVLVNLLHNAIKFTQPGGELVLSVKSQGNKVKFSIRDTGVGIAEKDLPRIFERFYKADRARTGGGTGLGLSIARHLVEAHGGKIWAESELGKGSTFFIELPAGSN